ncbi:diaminopimelate decarboxylase [Streptomyces sp. NPDC000594]|uniref:diaminopimelate decarboxylase family protein n=1 Tax=Streptomyces sp. NPDC000594 TaxID=3154261 RepID=UPI00333207CC
MTAVPALPLSLPDRPAAPSARPVAALPLVPEAGTAVGGVPLLELAERYGTPLHVLDEDEVRSRARAWRRALPDAEVVYAAGTFLCRAVVDWMAEEGLGLAVRSAGELELAAARGFPVDRIVLHGSAKSPQDLRTALRLGVGRIVIESGGEIARLAAQVPGPEAQQVMVRVLPDIEPTGGADRTFGLAVAGGDAEEAVARVLGLPSLELVGLHCRPGTRTASPERYVRTVRRLVAMLARIRDRHGIALPELDLGGGFAVSGPPGDPAPAPAVYGRRIHDELVRSCAGYDYPVPRLTVEPGRSLMAPAGVALYRVLAVKRGGGRVLAAVDGGTGDRPGAALRGTSVRRVGRASSAPPRVTTVVGRDGGAGDVLADAVELPEDLRPGDVLAVPVSGGCPVPMASPVVAVRGGWSRLLVRRETFEDHRRRDIGL